MSVATPSSHHSLIALIARAPSALISTRWSSVAVALVLAACAQGPQAAVQTYAGALSGESAGVASHNAVGCDSESSARVALKNVDAHLQAHGMALTATCPPNMNGWQVQVRVIDGLKASKVVRGPLADGQDVDMGTPAGVALTGASGDARGFSPDVQHNRAWLAALMARHRFDNLPDAWWHFAQRGPVAPGAVDAAHTDVAAR